MGGNAKWHVQKRNNTLNQTTADRSDLYTEFFAKSAVLFLNVVIFADSTHIGSSRPFKLSMTHKLKIA